MNVNFELGYPPSQAEDGKFVAISPTDLQTLSYPATGTGRYAILTYVVGGNTSSGSTTAAPLYISTLNPSRIEIQSVTVGSAATIVTWVNTIKSVEIYNNSSNTAYLLLSTTTFNNLTAKGLIIPAASFYNYDAQITTMTIGATAAGTDLRIIGHY